MASSNIARGLELRRRLREATPGDTIYLNTIGQEFQGPFVIDRPVTLVGNGSATQLFAKGSPALLVCSSGVRLQHLEVQDTYAHDTGIGLLHLAGSSPSMENVKVHGQVSTMAAEQLVDLGELIPKQPVTTYLELSVSGPATVRLDESSAKWLTVNPSILPAAGVHTLTIGCQPLDASYIVLGKFEIVTTGGAQPIWVTGAVLSAPLPPGVQPRISLLIGNKYRIRFADYFAIGKGSFPGLPSAARIADKQAAILREPSGLFALFQPWATTEPTEVNGFRLTKGQRVLLKPGDTIGVGGLRLLIEASSTPSPFATDKASLDLGSSAGATPPVGLVLSYSGSGKEKVNLHATVPWLQSTPAVLELKKGVPVSVQISCKPDLSILPQYSHVERGAIMVLGKTEALWLDAKLQVEPRTVVPAHSGKLEFGIVADWANAVASVVVSNAGTQDWRATVKPDRGWLSPTVPSIDVPSGGRETLTVRLNPTVESLPTPSDQTGKLILEGGGARLEVDVTLRLQLREAEPVVDVSELDFGEMDEPSQISPKTIFLSNNGTKDWKATLNAKVGWLEPATATFTLSAGTKKSILIKLADSLPEGSTYVPNALVIFGDGKQLTVAVRAKRKKPAPRIGLTPKVLDFGRFSVLSKAPIQRIELENRGNAPWIGRIVGPVWLTFDPPSQQQRVCPPKSKLSFTVSVNDQVKEGQTQAVINFVGPPDESVQCVIDYAPQPDISVKNAVFGMISGHLAPPQKLKIENAGAKAWVATVNVSSDAARLLTVGSQTIHVPANGHAELGVVLTDVVDRLPEGTHRDTKAIALRGGGLERFIGVSFELPPFDLQATPGEVTFRFVRGDVLTSLGQSVIVRNSGRRPWRGTFNPVLPWLTADPAQGYLEPGQSMTLNVGLLDGVLGIGTGETVYGRAVSFERADAGLDLRVSIKNAPAAPTLDIDPDQLDFGRLTDDTGVLSRELKLRADGDWQARILANSDWFEPLKVSVANVGGRPATVRFQTTDKARLLDPGVVWGELELQLIGSPPTVLPVRIERIEAEPKLEFSPAALSFQSTIADPVNGPQTVRVINRSTRELRVVVGATESWLTIGPSSADCPVGQTVEFEVRLNASAAKLLDGIYRGSATFRVGGHNFVLPASVQVDRTVDNWSIADPQYVGFGHVSRSAWNSHPAGSITIINSGLKAIDLSVIADNKAAWLEAPPSIRVEPGGSRKLVLRLRKDSFTTALGEQKTDVRLIGAGPARAIPVTVSLVRDAAVPPPPAPIPPAKVSVEPGLLTFKVQQGTEWARVDPLSIRISNPPGQSEWQGRAKVNVNWLSITPTEIVLASGQTTELLVRLKPSSVFFRASGHQPGSTYDNLGAITIDSLAGGLEKSIRVMVESAMPDRGGTKPPGVTPELPNPSPPKPYGAVSVSPNYLDFGDIPSDGWDSAQPQMITVHNHTTTVVTLRIAVNAAWLSAAESEATCPPGQSHAIQVKLRKPDQVFERSRRVERYAPEGVIVTVNGVQYPVAARSKVT